MWPSPRWTWTTWPWSWLLTVCAACLMTHGSSLRTPAKKCLSSGFSSSGSTQASWMESYSPPHLHPHPPTSYSYFLVPQPPLLGFNFYPSVHPPTSFMNTGTCWVTHGDFTEQKLPLSSSVVCFGWNQLFLLPVDVQPTCTVCAFTSISTVHTFSMKILAGISSMTLYFKPKYFSMKRFLLLNYTCTVTCTLTLAICLRDSSFYRTQQQEHVWF